MGRKMNELRSPKADRTPLPTGSNETIKHNYTKNGISNNILIDMDAEAQVDGTMNNNTTTPQTKQTLEYEQQHNIENHALPSPLASIIAQTDSNGIASTPRAAAGTMTIDSSSDGKTKTNGTQILRSPTTHKFEPQSNATTTSTHQTASISKSEKVISKSEDSFLDTIKHMCCCLYINDDQKAAQVYLEQQTSTTCTVDIQTTHTTSADQSSEPQAAVVSSPQNDILETNDFETTPHQGPVKLLGKLHADDKGKKCLVLDLDETLVHSSFRAVPGADFVIPVQIEEIVHFVYVAKRPGVDEFLVEMAKHYEIVVYTASLNKYADPLLDLLDTNRVIRARLFRESCVFYEGSYVKDLSLLNRDLSQSIIVDNSPSSYIFHPENAIDCTSFIDDPSDRELDQIGAFLKGVKNVKDVTKFCQRWRDWPNIDVTGEE